MKITRISYIQSQLQLKYGLPKPPTEAEIQAFYKMFRYLNALDKGSMEEKATSAAASSFEGVGTSLKESEADTIEMLLKLIEAR